VLCELQARGTAELSGRRTVAAGITERFGDDIFEYLEKHGQMEITWPSSDPSSGGKRTWMLTNQVPLQPFGIAHTDAASLEIRQNRICWAPHVLPLRSCFTTMGAVESVLAESHVPQAPQPCLMACSC
jgi:hypothetical protein